MRFETLKNKLKYEILKNNRRGTVQYFCDLLKYDDDSQVAAALGALEDQGLVSVIGTVTRDGGNIVEGVYGPSVKALTNEIMKGLKEVESKYAEKYKLNRRELKKAYPILRKQIYTTIQNARAEHTKT
jgi:hypothetical protein